MPVAEPSSGRACELQSPFPARDLLTAIPGSLYYDGVNLISGLDVRATGLICRGQ